MTKGVEARAKIIRLVCLGGSITFGRLGLSESETSQLDDGKKQAQYG